MSAPKSTITVRGVKWYLPIDTRDDLLEFFAIKSSVTLDKDERAKIDRYRDLLKSAEFV